MANPCIEKHYPELAARHEALMKLGIMSDREAAIKVATEQHKVLHDELNNFKKSIGVNPTAYLPFDNTKEIQAVHDTYNPLIKAANQKFDKISAKQDAVTLDETEYEKAAKNIFNESKVTLSGRVIKLQGEVQKAIDLGIKKWGSKKGYHGEEFGTQSEKEIDVPNYSTKDERYKTSGDYKKDFEAYRTLTREVRDLHTMMDDFSKDLSGDSLSKLKKRLGSIAFNLHSNSDALKVLDSKEADAIIKEINVRGIKLKPEDIFDMYEDSEASKSQMQQMKNNVAEITNIIENKGIKEQQKQVELPNLLDASLASKGIKQLADETIIQNKVSDTPKEGGTTEKVVDKPIGESGEEEGDGGTTSVKNEITNIRRKELGLAEAEANIKKSFGATWDEAKAKIDEGFDTQDLVDELKRKPRAVSDVESALLLYHQNTKEIELSNANESIAKAAESGDNAALSEARVRRLRLKDELQDLYNVDKAAGKETARGLSARQMMVDRKYSLVNMENEVRAANDGKPLTPAQEADVEKLHEKIKQTQGAFDEYVKQAESQIKDLQEKILGKKIVDKKSAAQKLRDLADKIDKSSSGQTYSSIIPITPKMISGAMRLIADGLEKSGEILDLIKKAIEEIKKLNPGVDESKLAKAINNAAIESGIHGITEDTKKVKDLSGLVSGIKYDRKAEELRAQSQRAKDEFDVQAKKEEYKNRTKSQKVQDTFIKWERAFKLTNPVTLGKLTNAGLTRMVTTPLEDMVGGAISLVAPKFSKGAIGEGGGLNINETAEAYKNGLISGMKDSAQIMKRGGHGKSNLDTVYGKTGELPPEAIDFFGQLHSALKAPFKRAIFERQLSKRLRRSIANGVDVSDPMVQSKILVDAYKDANRAIFMQDNRVSTGWQKMVNYLDMPDPKTGRNNTKIPATVLKWLVPFVKVPTNIAAEIGTNVYGVPVAAARLVHGVFTGGLEKLPAEQKDLIIRELKKGSLGFAALALGYFNPQIFGGYYQEKEKRDAEDAKAGTFKILGYNIPVWLVEMPIFQAMQVGATVRRVKDAKVKGEEKGISEGVWAGALGMLDKIPMADQVNRTLGAMKNPNERQWYLGELAKSTLVPTVVQKIAEWQDPEEKRVAKTIPEHVESGIPILRESLPSRIGIKDRDSQEYQFLKEKQAGIVPYDIKKLKPVDNSGKLLDVTDEKSKDFLNTRERIIKRAIASGINGEYTSIDENGVLKKATAEDFKNMNSKELQSWLMTVTKEADKRAMQEVFRGKEMKDDKTDRKFKTYIKNN